MKNFFSSAKRRISLTLVLALALTLIVPMFSSAQKMDSNEVEKLFIEKMKRSDEIMVNVQQERQKEIADAKIAKKTDKLSDSELNTIIEKGDKKLKESGFEIYKVDKNSRKSLEEKLKTNFDSFFRTKETDGLIPEKFTVYIPVNVKAKEDSNIVAKLFGANTAYAYSFEDYPWDWRSVYVYASDDPMMAKTGYKNIYSKYHSFPYSQSLATILNRSYGIITGTTTRYTWIILTALGIDLSSIGSTPNESYDIRANAAWTRKFIQIWNVYDSAWQNGSCTEYTNWDTYEYLTYYHTTENRVLTDSNSEQGTTYADHWNDYSWLINQAKNGFWYSYIVWDITGDHKVSYNGTVEITLSENF